ncbi:MAG: thiol reductant ABC exporter subunit CydD [Hyphomicrobiales bacterium]|nr:thiol reductant ABC exporter subunit CydD [Hyphomicrobiales bacterium]
MSAAAALLKSMGARSRAPLGLSLGAAAASALAGVAFAFVLARVVDAVLFRRADLAASVGALAGLAALAALRAVLGSLADIAGFDAAATARRALFERLLDHVFALGPVRLADVSTGDLTATLTEAVAAVEPYYRRWLPTLATVAAAPLAILALVLPLDWESGLVLLGGLPLFLLFMVLVGKGAEKASSAQWASLARLGGHLLDAVQGLRDLKLFRAAEREIAVVRAMADEYRRETMRVLRLAFLSALVLEFFATMSIALIAVLIGFRLLSGELDFRTGFFILLLAPQFYGPLRAMGAERHARMEAVAAAERMAALLARAAPSAPRIVATAKGAASVRFENVCVRYGEREALRDVTLDIAPGEHVALVGPSGAGKSSLFSVLLGFVAPSSGRVSIDGVDLAGSDAARPPIAYAPQRAHVYDDSVAANVALGRSGDLAAALEAARAKTIVDRLPNGADTIIGESGQGVSGGEMQRLSIARAFFAPAPLVLFDEPTAHLDADTESAVGAAIDAFARGRTMITIAHRLATIRKADRIVVLEAGRIVEQGGHAALIARGGVYAGMVAALESEAAQ